jgi:hypothetical protein
MNSRNIFLGAAALLATAVCAGSSAYAATEEEIGRLHAMCMAGDRDACAHREAIIHDHDHESEWRLHHPEWYR